LPKEPKDAIRICVSYPACCYPGSGKKLWVEKQNTKPVLSEYSNTQTLKWHSVTIHMHTEVLKRTLTKRGETRRIPASAAVDADCAAVVSSPGQRAERWAAWRIQSFKIGILLVNVDTSYETKSGDHSGRSRGV